MRVWVWWFAACFAALPVPESRAADGCTPGTGREGQSLEGEVSGGQAYRAGLLPGWTLELRPSRYGFDLRLLNADGIDLSQMTPPFRFVPNPRDIYGWHFRNKDNTGPNDGSVNAPQHVRDFVFDPGLSENGGFDPWNDPWVEPTGRGRLDILDFRLTDPEVGAKAQMTYLKFKICVSWPDPPVSGQREPVPGHIPE